MDITCRDPFSRTQGKDGSSKDYCAIEYSSVTEGEAQKYKGTLI